MAFSHRVILVVVAFLFLSNSNWAQTATTSLKGTVSDPQGGALAGATLTLADASKGYSRSATADEHGFYE